MIDHANPFDLLPGEGQALPCPESLLVQDLSHFAVAVLVEQTIDLSDHRWFGFANLCHWHRPFDSERPRATATQQHVCGNLVCLEQRHIFDEQAQHPLFLT